MFSSPNGVSKFSVYMLKYSSLAKCQLRRLPSSSNGIRIYLNFRIYCSTWSPFIVEYVGFQRISDSLGCQVRLSWWFPLRYMRLVQQCVEFGSNLFVYDVPDVRHHRRLRQQFRRRRRFCIRCRCGLYKSFWVHIPAKSSALVEASFICHRLSRYHGKLRRRFYVRYGSDDSKLFWNV